MRSLGALRMDPYDLPSYTAFVEVHKDHRRLRARAGDLRGGACAQLPRSGFIRLSHADLLFFHGDRDLAVKECQRVLDADPADGDALRRLTSCTRPGRKQEGSTSWSRRGPRSPQLREQPGSRAGGHDERGDGNDAADCLLAAARSGPATAEVHVYLARRLSRIGRRRDALVELARGLRVATISGDAETAGRIEETMAEVGRK